MDDSKYLAFLSQRISSLFGLYFPENQWNNLIRCLKNAALDLDYETSLKAIFEWLSQRDIKDEEVKILTKHLTIGETYFFREKVALNLFQKIIIAEIRTKAIQGKLNLRIWSAGCSSGEEPYSIAILLKEMLPDIEKWEITILATDLNHTALEKAKSGIYTSWSFRETSEELKNKYFVQRGKEFHIIKEIKQMVQFERLNLLTAAYPATSTNTHLMDVVFCRNVLMYFAPETIRSIAKRFHQTLNQEGWLITSQVELNDDYFAPFLRVKYENGIFYQKKEKVTGSKIENVGISTLSPKVKIGINETLPKPKGSFKQVNSKDSSLKSFDSEPLPIVKTHKEQDYKKQAAQLFASANYAESADLCIQLIENVGFKTEIVVLLVKSYANLGKLVEAKPWIDRLIAHDTTNAEIRYLYATILIEGREWELAEKVLLNTIYLKPDYIAAQLSLCNVLIQRGKNELASKQVQLLNKSLEKWNDDEIVPDLDGMTAGRLRQMAKMLSDGIS